MGRNKSKVLKKRELALKRTGEKRDIKGRFLPGVSGNPNGRPEGVLNKFTRIKEQLAEVFEEIDGKQMTINFAKGGNRNFARFLDHIVTLANKQNHEGPSASVVNIIYGYRTKPNDRPVRAGQKRRA